MLAKRRTHFTSEIVPEMDGHRVVLMGWVHNIRDKGSIKFILLRDKEGIVQVTVKKGVVPDEVFEVAGELHREDVIEVVGVVKKSPVAKAGVEIIPESIRIINRAVPKLPIDIVGKTKADLKTRLDYRVLDLRRRENWAIFRIESVVLRCIREVLYRNGFIEVFTPKIIVSATEGGANLFEVKYFERVAYLAQSPQLYKEQLASVFERVFEIAPAYRAEKHDTSYHLNEFISVDVEMAFADMYDVMELLEEVIHEAYSTVKKECSRELAELGLDDFKVPKRPFKRFTYEEVLNMLNDRGFNLKFGDDISSAMLKNIRDVVGDEPYFIYLWPTETRPFYTQPCSDRPELSEAFDLVIEWLEVASGGTRVHDKELLIKRLKEQGLNPENFKYHLQMYDYGVPPHAGWGLGFARLMMMMLKRSDIREVVLYPRDRYRLVP